MIQLRSMEITLDRLVAIREQLEEAMSEDLTVIRDDARTLRELKGARQLSTDMRIEACRIECTALRLMGQRGVYDGLVGMMHKVARDFAAMTDDEFAEMLDMDEPQGPAKLRDMWLDRDGASTRRRHRRAIEGYEPKRRPNLEYAKDAAHEILAQVCSDESSTTVTDAAERLREVLDLDPDDRLVSKALRSVVREAMASEDSAFVDLALAKCPRFIVVGYGKEAVRVPIEMATVSQWRWYLEYRRNQVLELLATLDTLEAVDRRIDPQANEWTRLIDALQMEMA